MSLKDSLHRLKEDHEIHRDVRAELKTDQDITDQHLVEITVDHGVVTLTGSADSYAQKWAIGRATGRVVGVRDIYNYLDVRPRKDDYRYDHQIDAAAKRALEWDARVPDGIRAEVTDGVVRLHGTVEHYSQKEAAEEAVRNLIGVRDVVNEIKLAPTPLPADVQVDVTTAIRRRFGVDIGDISIAAAGGVVTLSGVVSSFAMRDDIERTIRSIPGVTRVDDQLLVT